MDEPSLEPPLPRELERYIFELAATNPENPYSPYFHLLLVCKQVNHELKPLIYRTVVWHYSYLTRVPLEACQYVQNLSIDAVRHPLKEFLSLCPNLRTLRSFDLCGRDLSNDDGRDSLPHSTRLERLWAPYSWNVGRDDKVYLRPQFVNLTHLDSSFTVPDTDMLLSLLKYTLEALKHLTHLQIQQVARKDMPILDQILLKPTTLKVLIMSHFQWHTIEFGYDLNCVTPTQKADIRLVRFSSTWPTKLEGAKDWVAGIYRHRLDTWGIAEGIQEARQGGYFRDPEEASTWFCPNNPDKLKELLHDWGLAKLAQSSELWAEYLRVH